MTNAFIIALTLTMDSLAISIAIALTIKKITLKLICKVVTLFVLFQVTLLVIGWCIGGLLTSKVNHYAQLIAGGLLIIIGIKMLWEGKKPIELKLNSEKQTLSLALLILLAIAEGIDALAVGSSLGLLHIAIANFAVMLAIMTVLMTVLGLLAGRRFGRLTEVRAELLGGAILTILGVKTIIFQ